jgi:riboflavin transporter FmnP
MAPLSTTPGTQAWIYAFSIILPMICFIFVTKWPGMKYIKSQDPKTKRIGQIAWVLIVLSTVITIWLVYNWTQQLIQSQINSINADFGGL